MKRIAIRTTLVLLLSIVLTVAVAWSCAYSKPSRELSQWAVLDVEAGADTTRQLGTRTRGVGWTLGTFHGIQAEDDLIMEWRYDNASKPIATDLNGNGVFTLDGGWPARCLRARLPFRYTPVLQIPSPALSPNPRAWRFDEWRTAIPLGGNPTVTPILDYQVLPVGILPLGMLINIAFWSQAGILIIFLIAAFRKVRGRVRRRRMLCGACGYPFGKSDVCSECGASADRLGQLRFGEGASPSQRA